MKMLGKTEAELKKSEAYKKSTVKKPAGKMFQNEN